MIVIKLSVWTGVTRSSVQISVVVAAIQTSYNSKFRLGLPWTKRSDEALKAVVEKVFLRVALMQESVGPKRLEKSEI